MRDNVARLVTKQTVLRDHQVLGEVQVERDSTELVLNSIQTDGHFHDLTRLQVAQVGWRYFYGWFRAELTYGPGQLVMGQLPVVAVSAVVALVAVWLFLKANYHTQNPDDIPRIQPVVVVDVVLSLFLVWVCCHIFNFAYPVLIFTIIYIVIS